MAITTVPAYSDPFETPPGHCLCGCGAPANRRFAVGHDGKLRYRLVRIAREGVQADRERATETLRRLDWLHFLTPPKDDQVTSPMAETRETALKACRAALAVKCPGYREVVKDELFQVGPLLVRPKGTGTKDGEWMWDIREEGWIVSRETHFLLCDVNDPADFYVVPSDYLRGVAEGGHHRWWQEGRYADDEGDPANNRGLDTSTARRVGKWPLRHYLNAWHLLAQPVLTDKTKGAGKAKPIQDTETGKEYRSESEAGKDLCHLVGGDPRNTFVWFKILRAFPTRFRTKNADGAWVALDHPSAPHGSTLPDS